MIFPRFLLCLASLSISLVSAQSSSTTSSAASTSTSTATPSIFPGTSKWTYAGCYNETTMVNNTAQLRALSGTTESLDTMTVQTCLDFCGSSTYAGLEYTKECYCAPYISIFSAKLDDAACDLPCIANGSQICGGALKLSVYQQDVKKSGAAATATMGMSIPVVLLAVVGAGFWGLA